MKRTDGKRNIELLKIRVSSELLGRIRAAKEPCGWGEEADSSFARHLIVLGIKKIEETLHKKQEVITSLKNTINELSELEKRIEDYAAKQSISVEQATADLGITDLIGKAIEEIEELGKIKKGDSDLTNSNILTKNVS